MLESELWIVLEFAERGDLQKLLKSAIELDWNIRIRFLCYYFEEMLFQLTIFYIRLALQAARAVNYLHSQTPIVIHRDIKSPNFLVTNLDNELALKLSDFGMSTIKTETISTRASNGIHWFLLAIAIDNVMFSCRNNSMGCPRGLRYTSKVLIISLFPFFIVFHC